MAPSYIHLNQGFSFPCLLRDEDTRSATADLIGLLNSRLWISARRGRCRGYWGIFGVTPDTILLGFFVSIFIGVRRYILRGKGKGSPYNRPLRPRG